MTDFKIRQGLSTDLFDSNNNILSDVILEVGCWYLCIDTVDVYVCVKKNYLGDESQENLTLRRVNAYSFEQLEDRVDNLEKEARYIRIHDEGELPTNFDSRDFNPNTAYYIITDEAAGFMNLYIFDKGANGYICTSKADLSVLEDKIEEVVDKIVPGLVTDAVNNNTDIKDIKGLKMSVEDIQARLEALEDVDLDIYLWSDQDLLTEIKANKISLGLQTIYLDEGPTNRPGNSSHYRGLIHISQGPCEADPNRGYRGWVQLIDKEGRLYTASLTDVQKKDSIEWKTIATIEDIDGGISDIELENKLNEKVPSIVKNTIETRILFGGNATTTTEDDMLE